MKAKLIFMSIVFIVVPTILFAEEIRVPFINRVVPNDGLSIEYDMGTINKQKIVCVFDNFYKGYLRYRENNSAKETGIIFGSGEEIYFTNKEPSWESTQGYDNLTQYHADAKGVIEVKNISGRAGATVTCFYLPENAN